MMRIKAFLACLWMVSYTCAYSQLSTQPKDENPKKTAAKDYLFHKQMVGGIKIATTGLDFYLQYGIIKNIYATHLFMIDYEWHIDYRDKKSKAYPYYTETGRNYYFGVQNRFHVIRFSYGFEKAIADKAAKNGVRLSWVGFAGGALGLIKPYYLNLEYPGTDGQPVDILSQRYSASNAAYFLNQNTIDEASPISRGLNQIRPVVGGHARTGLNFDFGSKDIFVTAIEAGVAVDIFYEKIPIYINPDSNHFFFLGLYLGIHIGKRW
jgi:hypothetical protein